MKIAKLSLVAAVAVAGLSTANAQPLEEAIKGVDVSGTVVYRYNDVKYEDQSVDSDKANTASSSKNHYKVGLSAKAKVNEDVAFNSRILIDNAWSGLETNADADADVGVELSNANFAYTGIANTTIIAGKQGLQTPWTNAIDSDGSEQNGTGVLALTTFGPITAAAGYVNQHNITSAQASNAFGNYNGVVQSTAKALVKDGTFANEAAAVNAINGAPGKYSDLTLAKSPLELTDAEVGQNNLMVAGLLGTFGPVNTQAWYLKHQDTFDSYFLKADSKVTLGDVKLGGFAQYNAAKLDGEVLDAINDHIENVLTIEDYSGNKYSLAKVGINGSLGIFSAAVTYGKTGKDGSGVLNNVAGNGMIGYNVDLSGTADSTMWSYDLAAQVTEKLNLALNYDTISSSGDFEDLFDHDEFYVQATYDMSKNLSTYVRLADGQKYNLSDDEKIDYTAGRVQVEYKF